MWIFFIYFARCCVWLVYCFWCWNCAARFFQSFIKKETFLNNASKTTLCQYPTAASEKPHKHNNTRKEFTQHFIVLYLLIASLCFWTFCLELQFISSQGICVSPHNVSIIICVCSIIICTYMCVYYHGVVNTYGDKLN